MAWEGLALLCLVTLQGSWSQDSQPHSGVAQKKALKRGRGPWRPPSVALARDHSQVTQPRETVTEVQGPVQPQFRSGGMNSKHKSCLAELSRTPTYGTWASGLTTLGLLIPIFLH